MDPAIDAQRQRERGHEVSMVRLHNVTIAFVLKINTSWRIEEAQIHLLGQHHLQFNLQMFQICLTWRLSLTPGRPLIRFPALWRQWILSSCIPWWHKWRWVIGVMYINTQHKLSSFDYTATRNRPTRLHSSIFAFKSSNYICLVPSYDHDEHRWSEHNYGENRYYISIETWLCRHCMVWDWDNYCCSGYWRMHQQQLRQHHHRPFHIMSPHLRCQTLDSHSTLDPPTLKCPISNQTRWWMQCQVCHLSRLLQCLLLRQVRLLMRSSYDDCYLKGAEQFLLQMTCSSNRRPCLCKYFSLVMPKSVHYHLVNRNKCDNW